MYEFTEQTIDGNSVGSVKREITPATVSFTFKDSVPVFSAANMQRGRQKFIRMQNVQS